VTLGDRAYKNHLDGYNQTDLLEGKGPSARHEIFYFGGAELGAVRVDNFKYQFYDQPDGWPGPKVTTDMPKIYNIRQDPFERTPVLNFAEGAPAWFNDFFGREAWLSSSSKSCRSSEKPPSITRRCRRRPPSTLPPSRKKYRQRSKQEKASDSVDRHFNSTDCHLRWRSAEAAVLGPLSRAEIASPMSAMGH
jgi:hypothetical protein